MKKNLVAAGILLILSLSFCSKQFESPERKKRALETRLLDIIQASGANVGVAFKDLESGINLFINEKDQMHAASTMKVPVMIEVFKQAEEGRFKLDDSIVIKNEFHSIADGSLYLMEAGSDSEEDLYQKIGKKISLRELLFRMITVSSNLATNILIELVEAKNIKKTMDSLGIHNMLVLRGVQDLKAFEEGLNNRTDAFDMMQVMEAIAENKAGSAAACREMIQILSQQVFRDKIPAGLPEGLRVANKTGSITDIDHDAALVFPEGRRPYVLVVLSRGIHDPVKAQELIAGISSLFYEFVMEMEKNGR